MNGPLIFQFTEQIPTVLARGEFSGKSVLTWSFFRIDLQLWHDSESALETHVFTVSFSSPYFICWPFEAGTQGMAYGSASYPIGSWTSTSKTVP